MNPKQPQNGEEVILTKTMNAPRELVFRVWTEAEHLAKWWGPHHFTNPVCELDARPGGAILIHMKGPDNKLWPMKGTFTEVLPPERLVFTSVPVDEHNNPLFEEETTVTFEEISCKTRVTVRTVILSQTPVAAPMLAGMEIGWTQSLERLELLVEKF